MFGAQTRQRHASPVRFEFDHWEEVEEEIEKKKLVASTEKKAVPSTGAMTCDKAEKIVSGYGFTAVKPTSCIGQVFAFNANRSGKSYVIKLSSTSGELTEVKKVQ